MFLFSVPKIFRGKVQEKSDFRVQGSILKKREFIFDSEHKAQNSYLQNPQLLQRKGSFSS